MQTRKIIRDYREKHFKEKMQKMNNDLIKSRNETKKVKDGWSDSTKKYEVNIQAITDNFNKLLTKFNEEQKIRDNEQKERDEEHKQILLNMQQKLNDTKETLDETKEKLEETSEKLDVVSYKLDYAVEDIYSIKSDLNEHKSMTNKPNPKKRLSQSIAIIYVEDEKCVSFVSGQHSNINNTYKKIKKANPTKTVKIIEEFNANGIDVKSYVRQQLNTLQTKEKGLYLLHLNNLENQFEKDVNKLDDDFKNNTVDKTEKQIKNITKQYKKDKKTLQINFKKNSIKLKNKYKMIPIMKHSIIDLNGFSIANLIKFIKKRIYNEQQKLKDEEEIDDYCITF